MLYNIVLMDTLSKDNILLKTSKSFESNKS